MNKQIIITDNKNLRIDASSDECIPRKGQIYRKGKESFMVEYIITETNDHEMVTTAFVKHVPFIGMFPMPFPFMS